MKTAPATFPAAVKVVPRSFTLSPSGGAGLSATVRLRYIDPAEVTGPGITESRLVLWKNISGTWTPQGGTPDTASNFVTLTGVSSFSEWAIAEGADLTLTKANDVSNSAVTGQAWNWTLTATNTGAPATFTSGQAILSDNLPNSNVSYGAPTVQAVSNVTGSANISCAVVTSNLTCTASGGNVTFDSNIGASSFSVVFSATPQAVGTYQNPRTAGGTAQIDPNNVIAESSESNNSPTANTVTAGKANTTTTITADTPDPSLVGQPVTVQWSVTVNAPGSIGAALTGNVTVSDGTNQCVAAVTAGQCDVTFTSPGAKSITATYAGDANYNGSASTPATAHQVNKADTTTTITSDAPDPSTPGQSVIVQWTVTVNAPGSGTPTGTVTVSDGVDSCNAAVATGQCTVTLNTTGARTLTATYPGDTNFNTSADTEGHQVCASSLVTTAADGGAGSLRQVIAAACEGATVTFDSAGVFSSPQTITLTTGELVIDKNLTVNAGTSQVTVSGNNASRVFNVNAGKAFGIIGLTLSGGQTPGSGGGILNDGTLTVVSATLVGHGAGGDGGAIAVTTTATSVTLINTTISGNAANGSGGGLAVLGGAVTSTSSTFTNNRADNNGDASGTGGGVFHGGGTTTLRNTIVAGNVNEDGASDAADDVGGTVDPASSFNLIGTGGAGGLTNGVNSNQVGIASPGLGPLATNGGRTQTHAVVSTSPAIDAGSNAILPADTFDLDGDANTVEVLPVDQRGFGRVRDAADAGTTATVDIGAYEADPTIENIGNQSTLDDVPLVVNFRTGDATVPFDSITATSSDTAVLPNANLVLGGTGSDRTLTITPIVGLSGTTTITVTAQKTIGGTSQAVTDTFDLTITVVNDPPTLDPIPDPAAIAEDAGVQTVNFSGVSAGGGETQTLVVTAVSDGTALIPNPVVSYTSPNATGSLSYTPVPNASGAATITVTVNDGAQSTSRSFTVTVVGAGDSPTISAIADQTTAEDTAVGPLAFTIGDSDGLTGLSVTASSSNTALVPTANLTLGGSGSSRSIAAAPAPNQSGSTTITVTVSDGTASAVSAFLLTVTPVADPPTITAIGNQALEPGQSTGPLAFTIGDPDGPSGLTVTAASSNLAVVPNASVVLGGSGAARTVTVTATGSSGSTLITVTVSDGAQSASASFTVAVAEADPSPEPEPPNATPPSAPFELRAVVQGRRVDLSWQIPAEVATADAAASGFSIEVGSGSGLSDVATFTTGVTTTFTIADLSPGTYFIRVRGVNTAGASSPSNEVQAVISGAPQADAPQRLRATITGSTVQLDWDAPPDRLPVDGYRVEASYLINATSIGVLDTPGAQLIVPGIGNGTYYARVRAIRGGALTSASNEIVVIVGPDSCTAAPPPPPAGITLAAAGNFVVAQWFPPGGPQPVERYIVSVGSRPGLSDLGAFAFSSATTSAGALVADGTYVVRVAAANRCGTSVPTADATITIGGPPPQVPGEPGLVTATVTGSTVRLNWSAPTTGGAPTRYIIEVTTIDGAPVASLDTGNPSTTLTYAGATAGVYRVRVRAANGAGAGSPSLPVVITVEP